MTTPTRGQAALEQIRFARNYVLDLTRHIPEDRWFWQPHEGVTHVAWQVGHLAMAQYSLGLKRIRGEQPEDEVMISQGFLGQFGKGSTPQPRADDYPAIGEIRATLHRVHEQVLQEIPGVSDAALDEPTLQPHPLFESKLGSLHWCAQHEMLHAGQLGLLRRLMGYEPLR